MCAPLRALSVGAGGRVCGAGANFLQINFCILLEKRARLLYNACKTLRAAGARLREDCMEYPLSEKEIFPFRPKPFYFITSSRPEDLTLQKFRRTLSHLKSRGFGGIVLFNKPPHGFDASNYLSDGWFAMVENAARACRELSLALWINDGFDFPPGDVAGRVRAAAPHLKQRHIRLEGDRPVVVEADWGFPAFEEPLSTRLFIKFVYEEYKKRLGNYFGDPIAGFFSDSDNRRVNALVLFDENSPMRDYFPWSSDFAESFRAAYGYDILPWMPAVLRREDVPQAVDYWEHAGRLMQGWFAAHHAWLRENGLQYTGHTSDSSPYLVQETQRSSCFTEGRFSDLERHFDYPGTDQEMYSLDSAKPTTRENFYTPHVIWGEREYMPKMTNFYDVSIDLRARQAASTAFQYGKKGVMCEMFAATNYGVSPAVLRQIAAYQLMQGVTFIVPHAYHHLFTGETKYFAPPDFSAAGMLDRATKPLNDELARLACLLSRGKPVCPVALVDPTEFVWRGKYRSGEYFAAFAALNRLPYGFCVCDTKKLLQNEYGFRAAVYAGIDLPEETLRALKGRGILPVRADELEKLSALIPCDVRYEGEGTPHFARRVIDGEEFAFLANIESGEPIRGRVHAYGREKELVLYPGDVRYISATYCDFPDTPACEFVCDLPEKAAVRFDRPNILPLEWFRCGEETVLKTEDTPRLEFPFRAEARLKGLRLFLPRACDKMIGQVMLDETDLAAPVHTRVFGEEYLRFSLPSLAPGEHKLTLTKGAPLPFHARIFLEGEFDASVTTDKKEYKKLCGLFNVDIYVPERAQVVLSVRRRELVLRGSWAEQGQPFYSGGAEYLLPVEVPQAGEYIVRFPAVCDVAELSVGGASERRICPPYDFRVVLGAGKNQLRLTVSNSFANAMECYLERGGVPAGGSLFRPLA